MKWKSWSGWRSTCLKRQYQFHEEKETLTHHEDASGTELIGVINNIQEVNDEIDMTSLTLIANTLIKKRLLILVMLRLHSSTASSCYHSVTTFCKQRMLVQGLVPSRHWDVKDLIPGLTWTGFTGHHTIQDKTKRSVPGCYRSSFGWWQSITLGILSTNRSH